MPQNQQPHNVQTTEILFLPNQPIEIPCTQPIDEIASYLNVVRSNRNLSNQKVLQSLQIVFDDTLDETGEQINTLHLNDNPTPTKEDF